MSDSADEGDDDRSSDPPPRPTRSPYTNVLIVVAVIFPLTLVAHVLMLFFAVPTPRATCENAVAVEPSTWPSAHASAIDQCIEDLAKIETILGPKGNMLTRLRAANFRRCIVRARNTAAFTHCIEGLNEEWLGQLTHWP